MPPGHPIILLKSNKFYMAAVSVKRSIYLLDTFARVSQSLCFETQKTVCRQTDPEIFELILKF